jgi:hypothetical protein
MSAHLTSGEVQYIPGYELYTFRVSIAGFLSASGAGQEALYSALCGWYCSDNRPEPADLAQVRVHPEDEQMVVTLKIRRGPEQLAIAMLAGIYCDRSSAEGIFVAQGDEPYIIPNDAFPRSIWDNVRALTGVTENIGVDKSDL